MADLLTNVLMVVCLFPVAVLAWGLLQTKTARLCFRLFVWLAGGLVVCGVIGFCILSLSAAPLSPHNPLVVFLLVWIVSGAMTR